jgi:hypothetical protein
VVKAENVQVRSYPSPPRPGGAPSFYRPRGAGLQSYRSVLITSDGMVYSATEWMAVLANLASGGALRRVLCPSRSVFKGSGVGASSSVIVRTSVRGSC